MSDRETLFDLPTDPEQIGILLPPANLRKINFSALDFTTARRATIEYIKSYYPNDFNDFVKSNGMMMLVDIQSSNVAKLSLRGDILANEGFLPTSTTEEAVIQHLALINQKFRQQTPAVVDIEISVPTALTTDLHIDPGTLFRLRGPDGQPVYYELYRAPGDFTSSTIIQASKRGVIGYGIEGRFANPTVVVSTGGPGQQLTVNQPDILEAPITVFIEADDGVEEWAATFEPLERFGPDDKVMNVAVFSDRAEFTFGDDVNGQAPLSGQEITVSYRVGGGIRGRIGSGAINETRAISPMPPSNSPIQVLFRNVAPSSGGTDRETIEQAKKRAPRDFAVRAFASDRPASIVTEGDYAQVATTFAHPVFGAVAKAIATIRTGLNANLVEIYILAEGPEQLVTPSVGLKLALKNYITEFNVFTDTTDVLDGAVKSVDVEMTVVVNRNADATFVQTRVNEVLDNYFNVANREMGQPLYVSELTELITGVDGVLYVDIFKPSDNILATKELADPDLKGVGINEIIIEGTRDVRVYYEPAYKKSGT